MKGTLRLIACSMTVLLAPTLVLAQVDHFGAVDTLYADVARVDNQNWSITISFTNDESVVGLSVPLKMSAGLTRVVADSAIYTGGRVEKFAYKGFRPDTAIQCIMLGMIANLGPSQNMLTPGKGRLVTVFVSSIENKPIERLTVDTTTLYPNNSLLVVADRTDMKPDSGTDPAQMSKMLQIIPAFVARQEEGVAETKQR